MELLALLLVVGGVGYWLGRRRRTETAADGAVVQFSTSVTSHDPTKYRFDGIARPEFRIEYSDDDGVVTTRDIYVYRYRENQGVWNLDCWCYLRDDRRTFRSDRILSAVNLDTNRRIRDIVRYLTRP